MSVTSKSPKAVLATALKVAQTSLRAHRHKNSPKKFTQHQLFACLVLKNFLRTDYRGLVEYLVDCESLREVIELDCVPHFTTFQKAAKRLLVNKTAQKLLDKTVQLQMQRRTRVNEAAIDSTGLNATSASAYFVKRRSTKKSPWKAMTYRRFPKLGVVTDVANHFIIACGTGKGPCPDVSEFKGLIRQAANRVKLKIVLADAGYDSESNHQFAREELKLRTIIPPKHGRPTNKPAKGRYRRLMQTRFDTEKYRKRAQVETVMSMIKRRQGSYCKGKTYWSRCRELNLMVLTHNIMILLPKPLFYRANLFPFFGASLFHFFQPYQRTNTKSIPTIFDNDLSGVLSAIPSTVALTFAGFGAEPTKAKTSGRLMNVTRAWSDACLRYLGVDVSESRGI